MFKKTIQVSLLNLIGFVVQFILNLFISSQFAGCISKDYQDS